MRSAFLGLLGYLAWAGVSSPADAQATVGPPNAFVCNSIASFSGGSGLSQIVAAAAGKSIYICGWQVNNSTTTAYTYQLEYGTGTNCGTGTTAIFPALTTTDSDVDHIAYAFYGTPAGTALCANPSNSALTGVVFYTQF